MFGRAQCLFIMSGIYTLNIRYPQASASLDPRPFWLGKVGGREGLGNKILLRSVLLECHGYLFLKLCFQIFNESVRYYSNFQNFHVLPYIQTLVSLCAFFPLSIPAAFQCSRHFHTRFFTRPFFAVLLPARRVWSPDNHLLLAE